MSATFAARVFSANYTDSVHVTGVDDPHLGERVVDIMLDVGDEALSLQLDAYHLAELRKVLQRAERWVAAGVVVRE